MSMQRGWVLPNKKENTNALKKNRALCRDPFNRFCRSKRYRLLYHSSPSDNCTLYEFQIFCSALSFICHCAGSISSGQKSNRGRVSRAQTNLKFRHYTRKIGYWLEFTLHSKSITWFSKTSFGVWFDNNTQ